MLKKNHVFPTENMVVNECIVNQIPQVKNAPLPKYHYGSDVIGDAEKLPDLMLKLDKIDAFISVEPNAVLFESHFKFAAPPEQNNANPKQIQVTNPAPDSKAQKLDFDE
jgi:hypothetical protein